MLRLYHNPRCTTSRKALAALEEAPTEFETVLYLKNPLGRDELIRLMARLEDAPADLVRKDKRFKDLGLSASDYAEPDSVADLLVEHPELMQRPIIDNGKVAFIGRPVDRVDAFTKS